MPINTLVDQTKKYLASFFFPLTLAVLAVLIWTFSQAWVIVFVVIFCLMTFLPLLAEDGRSYLPLLLFAFIMTNVKISFATIPIYLYFVSACLMLSLILYLILHRVPFRRGDLLLTMAVLFVWFFISYLYNSSKQGLADETGIFYLVSFFIALVLYSLLSTVLGKGGVLPYFSETVVLLSLSIVAELFIYYFRNGFEIAPVSFSLGWSYTSQTASTLLCLALPFYGILIYNKKIVWIIPEALTITSIILLSADSGLLCLIFMIIPLILLTFRSYGKFYSYISLVSIVAIGITFAVLLAVNTRFNARVMTAIQSLSLFDESAVWRKTLFEEAIKNIKTNPYVGTSISSFTNSDGTLTLASNTILTTMVLGGSIGLVFYVIFEIRLYYLCLRKQTPDRWLFFLFLLVIELIGLIDNTIYNMMILVFFLTANACYQMSNRPEDVLIHEEDYRTYVPAPESPVLPK
jgi:hypothetical protein